MKRLYLRHYLLDIRMHKKHDREPEVWRWIFVQIVKKVNLYCLSTYIQADAMKVEFPEMMSEVIASQLPKVLAGMVRPLMFHNKWSRHADLQLWYMCTPSK